MVVDPAAGRTFMGRVSYQEREVDFFVSYNGEEGQTGRYADIHGRIAWGSVYV